MRSRRSWAWTWARSTERPRRSSRYTPGAGWHGKHGGRRAVTKGHHIQLGIYTLMAEQASGERLDAPAEIIGLQTTKEAPVATGEVADVKTPLLGTEDHPGLIQIAALNSKVSQQASQIRQLAARV